MLNKKLKPVLPSLREKKRYIAFQVISKEKLSDSGPMAGAIMDSSLQLLGQIGAAKANIMVLSNKWDPKRQAGILKVSNRYVDAVKASFVCTDKIEGREAIIRSLGGSGMLNKAEKEYLKQES